MKVNKMVVGAAALLSVCAVSAFAEHGTNTGGSDAQIRYIDDWCSSVKRTLERANRFSYRQETLGRMDKAYDTMLDALTTSQKHEIDQNLQGTLTFKMLVEGSDLAEILKDVTAEDTQGTQETLRALHQYFEFLDNKVNELDTIYYVPYREIFNQGKASCHVSSLREFQGNRQCPGFDRVNAADYEDRFGKFGRDEIRWLVDGFTQNIPIDNVVSRVPLKARDGRMIQAVYPKGVPAEVFLQMAATVVKAVKEQLQSSLVTSAYACTIADLDELLADLTAFNSGDTEYYVNARYGINFAVNDLNRIAEKLAQGIASCARE